ncbi:MAG: histidine phosphatase family protein [Mycobacterium sp.]
MSSATKSLLPGADPARRAPRSMRSSSIATACFLAIVIGGVPMLRCTPAHASGWHDITLTFVRHAQSASNAAGIIDTSTPGPELTPKGWCQAAQSAGPLSANHYDGVYASTMVRTQETAKATAEALGEPVGVLAGLREIEAGDYEGQPEASARTFLGAPMQWLNGDRNAQIPGSLDGDGFEARFSEAVEQIYNSGQTKPVAFSHGGAIMIWVLMNVHNPDQSLLTTTPLPNLGRVVIRGNPNDGWTLQEWNADPPPC